MERPRPAACDRLSTILGIARPKAEEPENAQQRRETAAKVSALVLANAFIFQEQLAHTDERVTPLRKLGKEKDVVIAADKHWALDMGEHQFMFPFFNLGSASLMNYLPTGIPQMR